MSEFLAPMDYHRAREILRRLDGYASYTSSGASHVHALLKDAYPLVFSRMEVHEFAKGALLLELTGANRNDPLVFVSHMDALTCREPICDGDGPMTVQLQRAHVVALLEALETLLQGGYRPGGDLFVALSMDGLTGGEGAQSMADYLAMREVAPCFVLDFGGYVTYAAFRRYLPTNAPLALIGITEKGQLDGAISTKSNPDAFDPKRPLDRLLKAGAHLSWHSRRASLCKASEQMLVELSRHAPFGHKLLTMKPRLTFPILRLLWSRRAILSQFFISELTVTGIRTEGEPSRSPTAATLTFSLNTVPGRKLPVWKQKLLGRLRFDHVVLRADVQNEHSSRSATNGVAWDALETAIEILFERSVIAPCLSPYVVDGRFYAQLRGNVYRFSPFLVNGEEALRGECTVNDAAMQTAVQFFRQMLSV